MEKEVFQVRYNAMRITSIMTFANVKGGCNQACKDVYFVRCIGYDDGYLSGISQMDGVLSGLEAEGWGVYIRVDKLPQLAGPEEMGFYTEAYGRWEPDENGQLPLKHYRQGTRLETAVKCAFMNARSAFIKCTQNASDSMIRNFVIKLFYWTDMVIGPVLREWNEKSSYKFIFCGMPKKQEYLFLYFLTGLGIDVMILSPEKELELDEQLLKLSAVFFLKQKGKLEIPAYQRDICVGKFPESQPPQIAPDTVQPSAAMQQVQTAPEQSSGQRNRVVIPPRRPGKNKSESRDMADPGRESVSKNESRPEELRTELAFEELAQLASSVVMIAIHNRQGEVIGTGSGIMVAPNGYILTNNHVASGGDYYSVRIEDDDKVYQTRDVIKYHSILDLALIRIERRVTPIPIYRGSAKLVRGQKVVAIGSPLGFFNSVSDGIISGFRNIDDVNMIQFTAPISHGSSGGAVLNMYGEVIGISTAGIDSGQNINLAVDYQDIINFVRGFL